MTQSRKKAVDKLDEIGELLKELQIPPLGRASFQRVLGRDDNP